MSLFSVVFLVVGLYSLMAIGSFLWTLVTVRSYDELQKRAVVNSLATSMLFFSGFFLLQSILSSLGPQLQQIAVIVSPTGPLNTLINQHQHIDIFIFACIVISVIYTINRYRYGLIDSKYIVKRIIFPLMIFVGLVILPGII